MSQTHNGNVNVTILNNYTEVWIDQLGYKKLKPEKSTKIDNRK